MQKWVQAHSSEAQQLTKPLLIEEFGRKLAPSRTESGTAALCSPLLRVCGFCVHIDASADRRCRPLQRSDKGLHRVGTPHSGCCSTSWRTRSGRAPMPSSKHCCTSELLDCWNPAVCRCQALGHCHANEGCTIIAHLRAGARRCRGRCSGAWMCPSTRRKFGLELTQCGAPACRQYMQLAAIPCGMGRPVSACT